MTTIVTRQGKGSPLSWVEADANFTNLNTDKIESTAIGTTVQAHSSNLDSFATVTPTVAGLALLDDVDAAAQRTTIGLGNVDNTSDATKNASAVTLTNKTITTPVINTNINFSGTVGAIQVNGVDKVNIPATGAVKMPGNVVAFNGYRATSQATTNGVWATITGMTEIFDTNNSFNGSGFQPTIAGYYQLNGTVDCNGTSVITGGAAIYKNGIQSATSFMLTEAQSQVVLSTSEVLFLNGTTDYIELRGFVVASASPVFGQFTKFSGHLLGAT